MEYRSIFCDYSHINVRLSIEMTDSSRSANIVQLRMRIGISLFNFEVPINVDYVVDV